jgi:hypothetical protein
MPSDHEDRLGFWSHREPRRARDAVNLMRERMGLRPLGEVAAQEVVCAQVTAQQRAMARARDIGREENGSRAMRTSRR